MTIVKSPPNNNGNGNGATAYYHYLSWQNVVATATLILLIGGAFWALAYNPIQNDIKDLKSIVNEIRRSDVENYEKLRNEIGGHSKIDESIYVTNKEYKEFRERQAKTNDEVSKLLEHMENRLDALHNQQQVLIEFKNNLVADLVRLKNRVLYIERIVLRYVGPKHNDVTIPPPEK